MANYKIIKELCILCGKCSSVCPANSIHGETVSPTEIELYIDQSTCIRCGFCERECPVAAIIKN